jgi:hypothetical protein
VPVEGVAPEAGAQSPAGGGFDGPQAPWHRLPTRRFVAQCRNGTFAVLLEVQVDRSERTDA